MAADSGETDLIAGLGFSLKGSSASEMAALQEFLSRHIFHGLTGMHPSFDSSEITYFTAADFTIVIERCTVQGVEIIGVEVFSMDGTLLDVCFGDDRKAANDWCLSLLDRYKQSDDVLFSATYQTVR